MSACGIATFRGVAEFGRYRGATADIEQAEPINLD
jgi:hypothetical protein